MVGWPKGVEKRIFPTLDSTMAEAARLRAGVTCPTWIVALDQTEARGRRGRSWVQPGNSFSATLIWRMSEPPMARAQRSFVASLALLDALGGLVGGHTGIRLKWPNDVLLNGGKVAGILLESTRDHLAIGIGVNLIDAPTDNEVEPGAHRPVSLAAETGIRVTSEDFLDILAPAYAAREAMFQNRGFPAIRADWLAHAAKVGKVVTARTANREITGTFETVDEQGVLVLNAPDGRHLIPAADIFFDPLAGEG